MNYGLLRLGSRRFALPVSAVREVLQRPVLSPVPLAPGLLAGMVLFRGEVLPVFDIAPLIGEVPASLPPARVVVLQHNSVYAGVAADQVSMAPGVPVPAAGGDFLQPLALELPDGTAPLLQIPALFQQFESSCATNP